MATKRTHYDVLGVKDSASVRDIKASFRRLALVWHPDRCKQPGAQVKFMELKTAYDTLLDLTSRATYDRELQQARGPPPAAAQTGSTTVGSDWNTYRTSTARRSSSVRKTSSQQSGFGFASPGPPPRPSAQAPSGDDWDAHAGTRGGGGFNGFNADGGGPFATASSGPADQFSSNSNTGTSGYGSYGFTRTGSYRYSRSSSRARSRSARSASSSRYALVAASSAPSPAQQWHTQYCHGMDDYANLVTSTSLIRTTPSGGSRAYPAGDGFAGSTDAHGPSRLALAAPEEGLVVWSLSSTPRGDDYAANEHVLAESKHALVLVGKQQTGVVKAASSFISISMGS